MNYKIFGNNIDPAAIEQMDSAMKLPCVYSGVLMPDCHKGYALPIGAVVATFDRIVPSWVGYDIGCGMSTSELDIDPILLTTEVLEKIKEQILLKIPVGFKQHATPSEWYCDGTDIVRKLAQAKASYQLGTLGSGNHFIEIGYCESKVFITIHSGSRGYGHGIATHYMKLAAGTRNLEGHHAFHVDSPDGINYFHACKEAERFALANRIAMTHAVVEIMDDVMGMDIRQGLFVNRNHNHVEEAHGLIIHRKGATQAEEGMYGVIPANMRDGCFLVKGKGNPDFLWSSSHGAGRVLSRSQAKKQLSLTDMEEQMEGIVGCISEATLDEAPDAYKNIYDVMEAQKESVEIVKHIKPLLNIKG